MIIKIELGILIRHLLRTFYVSVMILLLPTTPLYAAERAETVIAQSAHPSRATATEEMAFMGRIEILGKC